MSAPILEAEGQVRVTAVVVMPRLSGAQPAARDLVAGGPIDAVLIDCSALEASAMSRVQELIAQLVDVRGARWIQLIEPPAQWCVWVRDQLKPSGMDGALSIVPRASAPE